MRILFLSFFPTIKQYVTIAYNGAYLTIRPIFDYGMSLFLRHV